MAPSGRGMRAAIGGVVVYVRYAATRLYILGGSILLGATIYQMMVVVPAFAYDLPQSLVAFNDTAVKTTVFWTSPIGPLTAVCGVAAVLTVRKTPAFRWFLMSVVLAILAEAVTIVWVLPMLRAMGIIVGPAKPVADAALTAVTRRWVLVDQLRCAFLIVPSFLSGLVGFQKLGLSTAKK